MAQKVRIELVDDLDGTKAAETITFGMDGRSYEIDLNKRNANKFRKSLAAYVDGGRRVSTNNRKPRFVPDTKAIREWAKANGFEVSDRGQIPKEVREAYSAANK